MTGNYIGNNPNGLDIVLSDSYETNNSQLIASTKCVNNVYNNLKELINSKGLPLGHIYLWPFSTPPDGSIQVNGSTYNRELYSDLWTLIQTKGWYKPEAEWQQIASANGGYCSYYSDGDGITTFRTPKFAPYQKLALASGDAGKYTTEGLPNITGEAAAYLNSVDGYSNGALGNSTRGQPDVSTNSTQINNWGVIRIDASLSSSIYGNSDHVTPESHNWIVCVVAYGKATNVGSVDVANVMSAVSQVQATAIEIDSSGYSSGQHWVRYKDGRQIIYSDWGSDFANTSAITFVKPFTPRHPALIGFDNETHPSTSEWRGKFSDITETYFKINDWAYGSPTKTGCWVAMGTWK